MPGVRLIGMGLNRNLWPGRNAWVIGALDRESRAATGGELSAGLRFVGGVAFTRPPNMFGAR